MSLQYNKTTSIEYNRTYSVKEHSLDIMMLVINEEKYMQDYNVESIIKKDKDKICLKVKDKKRDQLYFLKIKSNASMHENEKNIYDFLIKNKNKYVENIISIYETKYLCFILSEYIICNNCCNLEDLINSKYSFKEGEINKIINNILKGIKFLHKNNIIHRDLKLQNIMYDSKKNIKIIDFDMAQIIKNDYDFSQKIVGTENYIAPESCDLKLYSTKSDIWSLGICFYRLITNNYPYKEEYCKFTNFYFKSYFKNLDFDSLEKYASNYGSNVLDIIKNMLDFNDSNRLSCYQLIKKIKTS
jgi:serine/threonine protein kinase